MAEVVRNIDGTPDIVQEQTGGVTPAKYVNCPACLAQFAAPRKDVQFTCPICGNTFSSI